MLSGFVIIFFFFFSFFSKSSRNGLVFWIFYKVVFCVEVLEMSLIMPCFGLFFGGSGGGCCSCSGADRVLFGNRFLSTTNVEWL